MLGYWRVFVDKESLRSGARPSCWAAIFYSYSFVHVDWHTEGGWCSCRPIWICECLRATQRLVFVSNFKWFLYCVAIFDNSLQVVSLFFVSLERWINLLVLIASDKVKCLTGVVMGMVGRQWWLMWLDETKMKICQRIGSGWSTLTCQIPPNRYL